MSKLQREIIAILGVKPKIDPNIELRLIIDFLKSYLRKHTYLRTLILGLSGGQDSALTGKICQIAINELRYETNQSDYQLIVVRLPCGKQIDAIDCKDAIDFIQPDQVVTINIKRTIQIGEVLLKRAGIKVNDYVKGNEKARERMKIQYSIAAMNSGLVVGTSNADEVLTGFFTKYGDGGTDINPIISLNKRQGRSILQHLDCPKHLYLKEPTADLEDSRPLLPDKVVLGITYDVIDDYLEGKKIAASAAFKIENWYRITRHKRYLPITMFDTFWK